MAFKNLYWNTMAGASLRSDLRVPDSNPILQKEHMENFRMVHFFMQSCRKNFVFSGPDGIFPNSMYYVDCKVPATNEQAFDYLDNFFCHTVGIRMGRKAVLAVFDGGLQKVNFPEFLDMQTGGKSLHPLQFRELFAKLTYKSSLSLRVPYYGLIYDGGNDKYIVTMMAFDDHNKGASSLTVAAEDGPITMIPILPESVLNGPAYEEWSQEEYAHMLALYTGVPIGNLFHPPDLVGTFLRDDEGNFADIPLDGGQ